MIKSIYIFSFLFVFLFAKSNTLCVYGGTPSHQWTVWTIVQFHGILDTATGIKAQTVSGIEYRLKWITYDKDANEDEYEIQFRCSKNIVCFSYQFGNGQKSDNRICVPQEGETSPTTFRVVRRLKPFEPSTSEWLISVSQNSPSLNGAVTIFHLRGPGDVGSFWDKKPWEK